MSEHESQTEPTEVGDAPARRGRGGWNRKYSSAVERVREWRKRQKQLKTVSAKVPEPNETPTVTVLPDVVAGEPASPRIEPTIQRAVLEDELRGLLAPGLEAAKAEPVCIATPTPEPTEWVPNWDEEARTDLPPRSGEHIQRLLLFETPEQTAARIGNDAIRYSRQRRHRG